MTESLTQPPGDVIVVPKDQDPAANGNGKGATVPPPADPQGAVITEDPPAPKTGRTFTTEDIEKARQQEKDKLYQEIENQRSELKRLREAEEARLKVEQDAQNTAVEEARKKAEEDMSAKELLAQKEQEWNSRLSQIEAERERDRALLDMERRVSAVQSYKAQRLTEEAEFIAPQLRDLVSGNTEEEVESSLADLKARTASIVGDMQQAAGYQRQQQRGVAATGAPPVGPMENDPGYETFTADDIRNMDMGTYMKNRDRLLGAAGRQGNRGLLG